MAKWMGGKHSQQLTPEEPGLESMLQGDMVTQIFGLGQLTFFNK